MASPGSPGRPASAPSFLFRRRRLPRRLPTPPPSFSKKPKKPRVVSPEPLGLIGPLSFSDFFQEEFTPVLCGLFNTVGSLHFVAEHCPGYSFQTNEIIRSLQYITDQCAYEIPTNNSHYTLSPALIEPDAPPGHDLYDVWGWTIGPWRQLEDVLKNGQVKLAQAALKITKLEATTKDILLLRMYPQIVRHLEKIAHRFEVMYKVVDRKTKLEFMHGGSQTPSHSLSLMASPGSPGRPASAPSFLFRRRRLPWWLPTPPPSLSKKPKKPRVVSPEPLRLIGPLSFSDFFQEEFTPVLRSLINTVGSLHFVAEHCPGYSFQTNEIIRSLQYITDQCADEVSTSDSHYTLSPALIEPDASAGHGLYDVWEWTIGPWRQLEDVLKNGQVKLAQAALKITKLEATTKDILLLRMYPQIVRHLEKIAHRFEVMYKVVDRKIKLEFMHGGSQRSC